MPTSNTIQLSAGRVRYLSAGEDTGRPPLLLLHGGGTDSATLSWGGVIGPLAEGRRVLAPDLPGYGESDRPRAPYSMQYYEKVALEFVDSLGLDQFDLAGLSMGGGISLALAIYHPERVRRLILVDTYGIQATYPPHFLSYLLVRIPFVTEMTYLSTRSRGMMRATLGQLVKTPESLTDELLDEVMAESRKPRAGKAFSEFQKRELLPDRLRTNFMECLDQVRAPTLIVHGSEDTLVPLQLAKEACWRIPDCRMAVLTGAGHWAQRDRPAEFLDAVEDFLA